MHAVCAILHAVFLHKNLMSLSGFSSSKFTHMRVPMFTEELLLQCTGNHSKVTLTKIHPKL